MIKVNIEEYIYSILILGSGGSSMEAIGAPDLFMEHTSGLETWVSLNERLDVWQESEQQNKVLTYLWNVCLLLLTRSLPAAKRAFKDSDESVAKLATSMTRWNIV